MAHGRDRQTDRPRYMCSNRPHLYYTYVYDISVANPLYRGLLNGHNAVPQIINCVDVLLRTSRHLHSHLLWTSLEPGHCHCVSDGAAHEY